MDHYGLSLLGKVLVRLLHITNPNQNETNRGHTWSEATQTLKKFHKLLETLVCIVDGFVCTPGTRRVVIRERHGSLGITFPLFTFNMERSIKSGTVATDTIRGTAFFIHFTNPGAERR